jgi:hypothetical protein
MRLGTLAASVLLASTLTACGGGRITLSVFAGSWEGHGEGLTITRDGVGKAEIYSGCCDFVLAVTFKLARPRAAPGGATATETATAVRIGDRSAFGGPWHPPHVGETATLRLKDGVITDPLSGADYCSPHAKHWVCGA